MLNSRSASALQCSLYAFLAFCFHVMCYTASSGGDVQKELKDLKKTLDVNQLKRIEESVKGGIEKVRNSLTQDLKELQRDAIVGMGRQDALEFRIPGFPEDTKALIPDDGKEPQFEIRCVQESRNLDLDQGNMNNVYAHNVNHGGPNQRWIVRHAPIKGFDAAVEILSASNKEALDMALDDGRNIYTHKRHDCDNQRFIIIQRDGNIVTIVNCHHLGLSLDMNPKSRNVYMGGTHGGANQLWVLISR